MRALEKNMLIVSTVEARPSNDNDNAATTISNSSFSHLSNGVSPAGPMINGNANAADDNNIDHTAQPSPAEDPEGDTVMNEADSDLEPRESQAEVTASPNQNESATPLETADDSNKESVEPNCQSEAEALVPLHKVDPVAQISESKPDQVDDVPPLTPIADCQSTDNPTEGPTIEKAPEIQESQTTDSTMEVEKSVEKDEVVADSSGNENKPVCEEVATSSEDVAAASATSAEPDPTPQPSESKDNSENE